MFCYCSCYYTHNIYIKRLNKHFIFINNDQFLKDYEEVLNNRGMNANDKESLINEIILEVERRYKRQESIRKWKNIIQNSYEPLIRDVYKLQEEYLDFKFLSLVKVAKSFDYEKVFEMVKILSYEKQIYSFPVFKPSFCKMLLTELLNFEKSDLPKERPNTMNNRGILIDEIGFCDNFSVPLREQYLDPIARALFPEMRGKVLDSHKAFTVGYEFGKEEDLGYHYDNSEVTLNACLGHEFEGGELYFGGKNTTPISESTCILVPHEIGFGILHCGQQYHGALPLTSGKRENLILWMRSSSVRNALCPMCFTKPSLVKADGYGDGFTKSEEFVNICNVI